MGYCCSCIKAVLCSSCFFIFVAAVATIAIGLTLSNVCISELLVVFTGQVFLLIVWLCFRRPRAEATWIYICLCGVVLVRETVLVYTGGVPCGLAAASNCQESRCKINKHILWIATSCQQRECVKTFPDSEQWVQVHSIPAEETRTRWLMTAHVCVWIALLLSILQLWRWHTAARDPATKSILRPSTCKGESEDMAQCIFVILAVPVTYGLCAAYALRVLTVDKDDAWSAESMVDAAELYSALALYAFQRLLVQYVDQGLLPGLHLGGSIVVDVTAVEGEALELRRSLQKLVAMGIKQYIFLAFSCNSIEVLAKVWNEMHPSSCVPALSRVAAMWFPRHNINITTEERWSQYSEHQAKLGSAACADLWNVTSLLMVVADFFTCSIALFSIWTYERTFAGFLRPMKPFWKFLGVKGLLSVGWLQALALLGAGFAAEGGSWSDENFRTFLNYYLVCIEALVLACLNIFAYPPVLAPWAACVIAGGENSGRRSGSGADDELDVINSRGFSATVLGCEQL